MSPYLFVMVMEILTLLLQKKVVEGEYMLHHKSSNPQITYLCFADDLIAFLYGDVGSALALKETLQTFTRCTALIANPEKSQIFLAGVDDFTKDSIVAALGFNQGELPIRYLGLPLFTSKLTHVDCLPLINKIQKKSAELERQEPHLCR